MQNDSLPILQIENIETARFKCVFPTCGGQCCKEGRPGLTASDISKIEPNLDKIKPLLRPKALKALERRPWLSKMIKDGLPTLEVVDGWCVFYNQGCVLHKMGMDEGDSFRYKPEVCARFPLEPTPEDPSRFFIRQWGHRDEAWDLFCLNPDEDPTPAATSLQSEIRFIK